MTDSASRRSTFLLILVLAALVGGIGAAAHGFSRLRLPNDLPWQGGGLANLIALVAGLGVALLGTARVFRIGVLASTALVAAVLLTALGALMPLIVVSALGLSSVLVGARLRRLWNDADASPDDPLIDLLIGAGAYGTVISVIAHVPLSHPATYAALVALPIALDARGALQRLQAFAGALRARRGIPLASWIAATLATMYTVVALFPEVGWDALAMHLFIPSHLAVHRSWNFDVTRYAWAVMPMLVDWIYGIGYVLEGERAARLANAAFMAVGAGLVFRLAVLAGANRPWAWFAAALYLATPLAFMIGSTLFIDAAWTAFLLGGVLMLLRPGVTGQPPYRWISAAVLIGFAAAAKAVTLPMLPALALLVLVEWRALRVPGGWRTLAIAAVGFVLAGSKPYVAAWLITGNPVYPYYTKLFGGVPFDIWQTGPQHYRAPLAWTLPYDITFDAPRFVEGSAGSAGFEWLLLFPAALVVLVATRHRRGLLLAIVGILMALSVFYFITYLRYVVPALAMLIAAVAVAGTVLQQASAWAARALAAVGMLALVADLAFLNAAGFYRTFPLETLASAARRRAFVEHEAPMRAATEFASRLPAGGGRLAFFGTPTFAAAPGIEALHPSWYSPRFYAAVHNLDTAEGLARALQAWNVRYVVAESAAGTPTQRRILDEATRELVAFRNASVRELPPERMFEHELLQNPGLDAIGGWTLYGGARHDTGGRVRVTVDAPAFQLVPVTPTRIYRNAVTARCEAPGEARVQVNWLDAKQRPLGTSFRSFACDSTWRQREQDVVAPPRAAIAVVYAASHTAAAVEIDAVSFRASTPR